MNKGDFAMNEKLFYSDSFMYVHIVELESDELLYFTLAISSLKGCWTSLLNALTEQSFPVLYVLVLYQFDAHFFLCIEEVVELPSFA